MAKILIIDTIDKKYITALERHSWQGNVVERSLIMTDGNTLWADSLSPEFHTTGGSSAATDSLALEELEHRHILRVLEYTRATRPNPPVCWVSASLRSIANWKATE